MLRGLKKLKPKIVRRSATEKPTEVCPNKDLATDNSDKLNSTLVKKEQHDNVPISHQNNDPNTKAANLTSDSSEINSGNNQDNGLLADVQTDNQYNSNSAIVEDESSLSNNNLTTPTTGSQPSNQKNQDSESSHSVSVETHEESNSSLLNLVTCNQIQSSKTVEKNSSSEIPNKKSRDGLNPSLRTNSRPKTIIGKLTKENVLSVTSNKENFGNSQNSARTDDSVSVCSLDTVKENALYKERKQQYFSKFSEGKVENMTMFDLIFFNPTNSPMPNRKEMSTAKNKPVRRESISSSVSNVEDNTNALDITENETAVDDVDAKVYSDNNNDDDEDSCTSFAPQIKIGPNGEVIIDQQSLFVKPTVDEARLNAISAEAVEENEFTQKNYSKKRKRSLDWTVNETAHFYKALSSVGTDFSLMKEMFFKKSTRSRTELKIKFKKEEKNNRCLVESALSDLIQYDLTVLEDEMEFDAAADRENQRQALREEKKKSKQDVRLAIQAERIKEKQQKKQQKQIEKTRKKVLKKVNTADGAPQKKRGRPRKRDEAVKFKPTSIVSGCESVSASDGDTHDGKTKASKRKLSVLDAEPLRRSGRARKVRTLEEFDVSMSENDCVGESDREYYEGDDISAPPKPSKGKNINNYDWSCGGPSTADTDETTSPKHANSTSNYKPVEAVQQWRPTDELIVPDTALDGADVSAILADPNCGLTNIDLNDISIEDVNQSMQYSVILSHSSPEASSKSPLKKRKPKRNIRSKPKKIQKPVQKRKKNVIRSDSEDDEEEDQGLQDTEHLKVLEDSDQVIKLELQGIRLDQLTSDNSDLGGTQRDSLPDANKDPSTIDSLHSASITSTVRDSRTSVLMEDQSVEPYISPAERPSCYLSSGVDCHSDGQMETSSPVDNSTLITNSTADITANCSVVAQSVPCQSPINDDLVSKVVVPGDIIPASHAIASQATELSAPVIFASSSSTNPKLPSPVQVSHTKEVPSQPKIKMGRLSRKNFKPVVKNVSSQRESSVLNCSKTSASSSIRATDQQDSKCPETNGHNSGNTNKEFEFQYNDKGSVLTVYQNESNLSTKNILTSDGPAHTTDSSNHEDSNRLTESKVVVENSDTYSSVCNTSMECSSVANQGSDLAIVQNPQCSTSAVTQSCDPSEYAASPADSQTSDEVTSIDAFRGSDSSETYCIMPEKINTFYNGNSSSIIQLPAKSQAYHLASMATSSTSTSPFTRNVVCETHFDSQDNNSNNSLRQLPLTTSEHLHYSAVSSPALLNPVSPVQNHELPILHSGSNTPEILHNGYQRNDYDPLSTVALVNSPTGSIHVDSRPNSVFADTSPALLNLMRPSSVILESRPSSVQSYGRPASVNLITNESSRVLLVSPHDHEAIHRSEMISPGLVRVSPFSDTMHGVLASTSGQMFQNNMPQSSDRRFFSVPLSAPNSRPSSAFSIPVPQSSYQFAPARSRTLSLSSYPRSNLPQTFTAVSQPDNFSRTTFSPALSRSALSSPSASLISSTFSFSLDEIVTDANGKRFVRVPKNEAKTSFVSIAVPTLPAGTTAVVVEKTPKRQGSKMVSTYTVFAK